MESRFRAEGEGTARVRWYFDVGQRGERVLLGGGREGVGFRSVLMEFGSEAHVQDASKDTTVKNG